MSLDISLYVEVDTGGEKLHTVELFEANITHNLTTMASNVRTIRGVSLYKVLWRPEELGLRIAAAIIPYLHAGLINLRKDKEQLLQHSPSNGWGTYEHFEELTQQYLEACIEHPKALIFVSR